MEGLVKHGYPAGIDPHSKVCFLLDSIKTDKFDSVKARITSDTGLRNDFDVCVTLYQDFIKQTVKSKTTPTVGISEAKTSAGKRKSTAVEDRYFTKSEYNALTAEAKRESARKRLKRGHKPGAKDSRTAEGPKTKQDSNAEVIQNLEVVKRSAAQLTKKQEATDDNSSCLFSKTSSKATPKKTDKNSPTPNRFNSALTRQTAK